MLTVRSRNVNECMNVAPPYTVGKSSVVANICDYSIGLAGNRYPKWHPRNKMQGTVAGTWNTECKEGERDRSRDSCVHRRSTQAQMISAWSTAITRMCRQTWRNSLRRPRHHVPATHQLRLRTRTRMWWRKGMGAWSSGPAAYPRNQRLLQPISLRRAFPYQGHPIPSQFSQFTLRPIGHEAAV
jgi:hypothetical protein